ncbi:MAG: GNAT family N-acetyltransferase [Armatimonadota bacterium]
MEPELTVRLAVRKDIPLLIRWRKAMMQDITPAAEATIDASMAEFAPWLEGMMAQPGRLAAFIGEVEGEPCAGAIVWMHEWYPGLAVRSTRRGYLFNVYTEPAWRRRGFAGQIVRQSVEWLREQGVGIVTLHASPYGQSVYANHGFKPPNMPEMTLRLEPRETTSAAFEMAGNREE